MFRHDRIHFWETNFLTVYIDCVIWHFELCWPTVQMNHQTVYHFNLLFFFLFVKFFLSLCHHFTFKWTVAIIGVHQVEYFSSHSCPFLTFWIYVPLLHVCEFVVDSGDFCQPRILLMKKHVGHLNFKTVAHLNCYLYFILNLTGALFPKLLFKFAMSFQQRFHTVLAVWLMLEGDFSVVLLVALSAVLTVVKIYISIAVQQTATELSIQGYTTSLCLNLVWTQRLISDDTLQRVCNSGF